jgi:hypothetical protein
MQHYRILALLVSLICQYNAQDTTTVPGAEWNGDPKVCIPNTSESKPSDPAYPRFPNKAEFTLERVEIGRVFGQVGPSQLTRYQYLYDYDANKLVLIKNANEIIDIEYYYYEIAKKSTYYRGDYCSVTDIPLNIDNGSF